MGVTINKIFKNNRTTAPEQTAAQATGRLNASNWYQILALDSAIAELQKPLNFVFALYLLNRLDEFHLASPKSSS